MRYKFFAIALLASLFIANSAYAQNTYYLPHIANGSYGGGSYRTTFILFNNTDANANAVLQMTDDGGNPLTMTIPGYGTNSTLTVQLPAGTSRMLQTDGQGDLAKGAATVTSETSICVSAIFSVYDSNGNFQTETGVGSTSPLTDFMLPVDTTGSFNTGLALVNNGTETASIALALLDTNGAIAATNRIPLARGRHMAIFISGKDQLFPSFVNFQGTLSVQSSIPLAAMVLRQNDPPLSFTSLPVVPITSTKQTLNLGQVANGSYGGGSYKTSFLVFNISPRPASVSLNLTKDDGTPFSVTIPGYGTGSSFSFSTVAPGGSLFLQTDGSGQVATGAAIITSSEPIGAAGIFTVLNSQGAYQTETGVGDSPVLTSLTLPVDINRPVSDTGVAFYNPGSFDSTLTFRLLDANGSSVGPIVSTPLEKKHHIAVFVSQLFAGANNFRGTITVTATVGVAALTLRQNDLPLAFTTLPVASGIAGSKVPTAALQVKTDTGITATGNVTLNESLPTGYKLTGTMIGPGQGIVVVAIAGENNVFWGTIDPQTGKYMLVLPSGTYTLKFYFKPTVALSDGNVSVTFAAPDPVQVSGDTRLDVALPAVPLFQVSGYVNGLNNLPPAANLQLVFTSGDDSREGVINLAASGTYQGVLPAGSFTASLRASLSFSRFQNEALAIYNLGSARVDSRTILPVFTVPATVRLSGTITGAGTPLIGAGVIANDTAAPLFNTLTFAPPPTQSTASADTITAQYQLVMAKNRTHDVNLSVPLMQGSSTLLGMMTYPIPANSVILVQDTANYNFAFPSLPGQVTISGQVTDGNGRPLSGVVVSAASQSITGRPNLRFSAATQTDASGNYRLVVLSGANYQVSFSPPLPLQ
jgi:hypothetical protein